MLSCNNCNFSTFSFHKLPRIRYKCITGALAVAPILSKDVRKAESALDLSLVHVVVVVLNSRG